MGGQLSDRTEYDAFISYSHSWDSAVAKAFQRHVQAFDRPWYRPRGMKLFRDETNLAASPHLWHEIEQGLSRSRWLVVMASPRAAASVWVREEIRWWLTHRSAETLLIAWTDGMLAWDAAGTSFDWAKTDALPREEMAGAFSEEPRWVDLRWLRSPEQASSADPRMIECVAEFVAPLTGKAKDELIGDHVRQHRRTVRLVRATVTVLTALLLVAVAGGITAYNQRNNARAQTLVAQSRQLVAESSSIQDSQPDLARQLLVQAYRLSPTAEASGALIASNAMPRVIHARKTIRTAVYSSRGLLAVADDGVRLFDATGRTLLASLDGSHQEVDAVAFSPDGRLLATGGTHGEVKLFDVSSGRRPKPVAALSAASGRTTSLVFTSGSRLIVMAQEHGAVLDIGDPSHPRSLGTLPDGALAASPTGDLIVTAMLNEGRLRLWNLSGSARLSPAATVAAQPADIYDYPQRLAFSANGQTLAVAGRDGRARLWDVADPTHPVARPDLYTQTRMGSASGITAVAFSEDASTLATGDSDGTVALWDVSDPLRPRAGARLTGHTSVVDSLSFNPDGNTLATVGPDAPKEAVHGGEPRSDTTVRLWGLSGSERTSASMTLPVAGTHTPSFSADSRLVAGGEPTTVWSVDDGQAPRLVATPATRNRGLAAFAPGGRTLFSGLPLASWDMTHPAKPRRMSPPAARPLATESVAFNPALPLLAARDRLGDSVQLWDIADRTQPTRLGKLSGTADLPQALAFSPDGALLAAPTDQGSVRLWHVAEHTPPTSVGNIVTAAGQATAVAFGPHGRTLLVGDSTGAITTWDLTRPGRPVRKGTSARHTGPVKGLAVHPGGTLAASAGQDGRIRLWDVSDPSRLVEVTSLSDGGLYPMATVAFSPDGRLLAVGGDRGIRLWSVDPTTNLQRLCAQSLRITPEEWAQYLPDQPYDHPCA